jgi:hypothetical protein
MTVIHVPRPPQNAFDPNRPISALLKMQIEHLHEAEKRLPLRHQSNIYINAIKTEGEAGSYIRAITEAIHDAHAEAERARRAPKRKQGIEIAAVADERAERKLKRKGRKTDRETGKKS